METRKRVDYKALCEAPFNMDSEYEVNFLMLVYTGRKVDERPVFRVVIAKGECKVCIGAASKEFWGIVGLDPETGESQWYNYNDCVSLEDWRCWTAYWQNGSAGWKRWIRGWRMRRKC